MKHYTLTITRESETMEMRTRNDGRPTGATHKPTRMFNTSSIMQTYSRPKIAFKLFCVLALCVSLLNTIIHKLSEQQLSFPIYSSLRNRREEEGFTIRRKLVDTPSEDDCKWVEPGMANQNPEFDLFSTVLTSYPGAAKRAAFMHLEGLTELLTGDDHGLNVHEPQRYAFYKSQYPHHTGEWSWGEEANQSVYILQNPRTALMTHMFLLSEIHYKNNWNDVFANLDRVFTLRPPAEEWIKWRDSRFYDEIHLWRWHIDFWMEGGLLRDLFSHELTNREQFEKIRNPSIYQFTDLFNGQREVIDVEAVYDGHCGGGGMLECRPVAIASYERIMDEDTGPQEVAKLAAVIEDKPGINVVEQSSRDCVWRNIFNYKVTGERDDRNRVGPALQDYKLTWFEVAMIKDQLVSVRDKYTSPDWISNPVATDLVTYVNEYIIENDNFASNANNLEREPTENPTQHLHTIVP